MGNQPPFPVLTVEGSPYEQGYQQGSQFKKLIGESLDIYHAIFKYGTNLKWDQVLELSKKFVPFIEEYDPDAMEEMQGIAKGVGIALENIITLNARSELTFLAMSGGITKDSAEGECTSLAATPEATKNKHMLLGQNWDWYCSTRATSIILKKKKKNKPNCVTFLEAGLLGKSGMNSAGMGFIENALISDKVQLGVPVILTANKILSATNLVEAMEMLLSPKVASSVSRLAATVDGECVDIELHPEERNVIFPEGGIITHTNHFTVYKPNIKDIFSIKYPHTLTRLYRANQLLAPERGNITLETFKNIFRDHIGKPNSICRHPDERLIEGQRRQTNASLLMDLNEKTFFIAKGPPCEHEYFALDVKDII